MLTREKGKRLPLCLTMAVLAFGCVIAPAVAQTPQTVPTKANECNGSIGITTSMGTVAPGGSLGVTLTHTNTMTNDNANNPIGQTLDVVNYVPQCAVTNPAGGCTTPAMGAGAATVNLASVGGSCNGGTITPTNNGDGTYTFMFPPSGAPIGVAPSSCTVTFNIDIPVSFTGSTLTMTADESWTCLNPIFMLTNGDSDSLAVMVVPTLGEAALVLLALVLLFGAWRMLRRRPATDLGTV